MEHGTETFGQLKRFGLLRKDGGDGIDCLLGTITSRWRARRIVEKVMGRKLTEDEIVHHLDCDPFNNEHSNLIVCHQDLHMVIHAKHRKRINQILDDMANEMPCEPLTGPQIKQCMIAGLPFDSIVYA